MKRGVSALACLAALLAALAIRGVPLLRGRAGPHAAALAIGLLVVLLHALVDFPFHIPALAATAAILAGSVLGTRWQDRTSDS